VEILNKKGISFYESWAELVAFSLLIIGLIVSLVSGSKVMSYFVITLCGMMFGRLWYRHKHNFKFTWFLIIVGFLMGYLLGNMYGSGYTITLLFLAGIIVSYYLHNKQKVKSVEY
jgi:hypothetical protein